MLTVVGILEVEDSSQAAAANMYLPLSDAQHIAGLSAGQVNQVHVQVGSSADTSDVTEGINDRIGTVSVVTTDSLVQIMGAVGRISARFSLVAGVVGALGGLLLSWTALRGMVAERTREIGVLMAVGWRRRDVVTAFGFEAAALSLAGAATGILLGIVTARLLSYIPIPELLAGPPGAEHGSTAASNETTLPVVVPATALVIATLTAVVGGTGAGVAATRRVTTREPARNLTSPG
jgi:putative ABC transport system permease protein